MFPLSAIALWVYIFLPHQLPSQHLIDEDDHLLPAFRAKRMAHLRTLLPEASVAFIFSGPLHYKTSNIYYPYDPQKDLLYLSGHKAPNSVLVLFKVPQILSDGTRHDEILFIQTCKSKIAFFEKGCLKTDVVERDLGIEKVLPAEAFADFSLPPSTKTVLSLSLPYTYPTSSIAETPLHMLLEQYREKIKKTGVQWNDTSLREMLSKMREIKTAEEIYLIKRAVHISAQGHIEAIKVLHAGMTECELQGVHEFVHKKYQSELEGYDPIVAGGQNGCILHYSQGIDKLGSGLVLMDVGAQYRGYTADITRTVPVSGRFSKEQLRLYAAVQRAQKEAITVCEVGRQIADINRTCRRLINESLSALGIIESPETPHTYFPHGATHHIGLYVHDVSHSKVFKAGMILTVEPGIYIPAGSPCEKKWWGIAIRIEDDILITEAGPVVLSAAVPKAPAAIEQLMQQKSLLSDYTLPALPE